MVVRVKTGLAGVRNGEEINGAGIGRGAQLRRWGCRVSLSMASILLPQSRVFGHKAYVMRITSVL